MNRPLAIAALLAFSLVGNAQASSVLYGQASVIDGDTVEVRGERVRMAAIDAPESSQQCGTASGRTFPCGRRAAMALMDRIGRGSVECHIQRRDRFGRHIAECFTAGVSLNAWLVYQGWAVADRRFGGERYAKQEAAARSSRRGIWQGRFVPPHEYRRGVR